MAWIVKTSVGKYTGSTATRTRKASARHVDSVYSEQCGPGVHVLPGARIRRRLFFRYTLAWTRPL